MNPNELKKMLSALRDGDLSVEHAYERLATLPYEDIGVACIDHHRHLRQGVPEIVFGEGKSAGQIVTIANRMAERGGDILITRLTAEKSEALLQQLPSGQYDIESRTFTLRQNPVKIRGRGKVLIICAGTSDLPVAREAAVTADMLGNEVEELVDVGVAGIHRLLSRGETLRQAAVIIVVAGMEGALPSVVGGLVSAPVIAVPTSVGYGAAFEGVAALLGMLNSCASGVTVVNIDNGFGAAFAATRINRTAGGDE
ncbi:MAG TPA: nickel pincer cofactor biosynthesis protein LarB [Desulfuromonadales bacterium]|nr:nickel pincer cofactor biosynthesis protein LarB [Desulfuromonadales bacterium]